MFRFKQFLVNDERSTMKVGTDALLLAALTPVSDRSNVLDIGTGCGVISIILAQRSNCTIDAIDIDLQSVEEARANFENSGWSVKLNAMHTSLQQYANHCLKKYDLIVSNPPFFFRSLKSVNEQRNLARHNDTLNLQDLFHCVDLLLTSDGIFCIILPSELLKSASSSASQNGFYLNRLIEIVTRQGKQSTRSVMHFSHAERSLISKKLTISDCDDHYTEEYRELMKPFLTIF